MAARPLWKGQLRFPLVGMAVELYSATKAMRELIREETKSKSTKKVSTGEDEERPATGDNVIDLMAALRKSLEKAPAGGGRSKARKSPPRKSKKKKAPSKKRKRA